MRTSRTLLLLENKSNSRTTFHGLGLGFISCALFICIAGFSGCWSQNVDVGHIVGLQKWDGTFRESGDGSRWWGSGAEHLVGY